MPPGRGWLCEEKTGADGPNIELTDEDSAELSKAVTDFVRARAIVNSWAMEKRSGTTHSYVARSVMEGLMK